jgi:DNA-binding IclR family transcriptional regulator
MEPADGVQGKRYHVQAVERAGHVLQVLADASQPLNLTSIAAGAKLSPATALRMLHTLQDLDLVQTIEGGNRYLLGFGILRMGQSLRRQLDVVRVAERFLIAVRDESGENGGLDIRDGDYWVPVASMQSHSRISLVSHIGQRLQLYTGASGKVLLSGLTDAEINDYLRRTPLIALSPTTPTTPGAVWEQIRGVRTHGYTVSLNERGEGGAAVAAPVFDHTGHVVASLKIGAVVTRFTDEHVQGLSSLVKRIAQEFSQAMGYNQM